METPIQSVNAPLRLKSRRLPDNFNVEIAFSNVRGALRRAMQDDVIANGERGSLYKRASFALNDVERLMIHFGIR